MTSLGHRSRTDSGAVAATASNGPRQLDFYEAMSDFQTMFPTLDPQLIECVLRDNNGVVHTTVDSLLRLSESAPAAPGPPGSGAASTAPGLSKRRQAAASVSKAESVTVGPAGGSQDAAAKPDDPPPSYEQALRASQRPSGSNGQAGQQPDRHHTHPPKHSKQGGGGGRHGGGIRHGLSSLQPQQQQAPQPPPPPSLPAAAAAPAAPAAGHHRSHSQPSATTFSSYSFRSSAACASSSAAPASAASASGSSGYRRWNPPLLGALPDDFLRISAPASAAGPAASVAAASSAASVAATAGSASRQGGRSGGGSGRSRSHHHKCSNCGRYHHHHRAGGGGGHRSGGASGSSGGGKPRDPSDQLPETPRQRPGGVTWQQQQSHQQQQAISPSSSYHSNGPQQPVPQSHSVVYNQILADERLAIALQNEEFLSLLRNDSDFMRTLQRDSSRRARRPLLTQSQPLHSRSYSQPAPAAAAPSPPAYPMQPPPQPAFPPPPFLPPPPRPSMPLSTMVETGQLVSGSFVPMDGYGADQSPVEQAKTDVGCGASAAAGVTGGGDDLNSQLRYMGKMSGRRFAEMARKFFGMARHYKQRRQQHLLLHQPQLLTMSAQTESTLNLLENGDFDAEDDGEVNPVVGSCGAHDALEEEATGEAEEAAAAHEIDRV